MCHIAHVPGCFCDCQAFSFIATYRLDPQIIPRLTCPPSARTCAQPAIVCCHRYPVFIDWPSTFRSFDWLLPSPVFVDWSSQQPRVPEPACQDGFGWELSLNGPHRSCASIDAWDCSVPHQEVGVDVNELKVILVGDEHQVDLKPLQTCQQDQHHNPEPYIEIRLKQDVPFSDFQHKSETTGRRCQRFRTLYCRRPSSWPLPTWTNFTWYIWIVS